MPAPYTAAERSRDAMIDRIADLESGVAGGGFTNEKAQDAVGGILTDTATINFTYDDAGDKITADVIVAGLSGIAQSQVTSLVSDLAAKQPLDATLTALAGLATGADKLAYSTGTDTFAQTDLSAFARTFLDDADAATVRATIGAGTGSGDALTSGHLGQFAATTSAQLRGVLSDETGTGAAYFQGGDLGTPSAGVATNLTGTAAGLTAGTVTTNANLTGPITSVGNATTVADAELAALAGLTSAADALPYFTGAGTATVTTLTAAARTVLDDATVGAMLTTLGGQPLDTQLTSLAALTYTGNALKVVRVNAGETDFELATPTGGGDALTTNPLSQFAATTSAQLAGVISDETGSGALVFATSPTLVTPALGTPTSGVLTNMTGIPAWTRHVYTTSDQTAIGTSYTDVTGLTFSVAANTNYIFEFYIWADSDATTTGIDVACNGPAIGAGTIVYAQKRWGSTTASTVTRATAYDNNTAAANSGGTTALEYIVRGVLRNGANAGTLAARIKREAVGSGPNVRSGSWGRIQQVA